MSKKNKQMNKTNATSKTKSNAQVNCDATNVINSNYNSCSNNSNCR